MRWNSAVAGCALIMTITVPQLAGAPLKVPFFAQQKNGCGAASAAMVLHYWSEASPGSRAARPTPEEVYRQLYRGDPKGIRLADIRHYLEETGLRVFTLHGRFADVDEHLAKGRPIVVALKPSPSKPMHFAVVVGAEDGRVWLNDPTRRRMSQLPQHKFEERWSMADRWMLLAIPFASE